MLILPSGYTELQWIQSSGTQYIDTGYIRGIDDDVVCQFSDYTAGALFGDIAIDPQTVMLKTGASCFAKNLSSGAAAQLTIESTGDYTVLFKSNGEIHINGVIAATQTVVGANAETIGLFGYKDASSILSISGVAKLKSFTVGSSRNLVPCKRTSDNAVGMYDTINDVFYENSGTGEFIEGPEKWTHMTMKGYKSIVKTNLTLPSRYAELEWLKGNSASANPYNQYLNIGLSGHKPSEIKYEAEFKLENDTSTVGFCGARNALSNGALNIIQTNGRNLRVDVSDQHSSADTGVLDYGVHRLIAYYNGYILDNNDPVTFSATVDNVCNYPLYLFNFNNAGSVFSNQGTSATIYRFKTYVSNTLVRDLVPCKRKSDNVLGMYDLCNTGKNLLNDSAIYSATVRGASHYRYPSILVRAGESYIFSIQNQTASSQNLFVAQSTTNDFTSTSTPYFTVTKATSFQVQPSEDTYVCVFYKETEPSIASCRKAKAMCEYGELTPTDYEPYDGFYMNEGTGEFVAGPEKYDYIKSYKTAVLYTPTGSETPIVIVSYKKNVRYRSDIVIPIVGDNLLVGTFVVNG